MWENILEPKDENQLLQSSASPSSYHVRSIPSHVDISHPILLVEILEGATRFLGSMTAAPVFAVAVAADKNSPHYCIAHD